MMKAVIQNGFGSTEDVLKVSSEMPKPILKNPNHVLVQVYASSVNTPDWAGTLGIPYLIRPAFGGFFRPRRNRIPGSDVAGVVEKVGANVKHVKAGDQVFGSTGDSLLGAFAEYALVPSDQLIHKPQELSWEQAAGAVMSGITAQSAIYEAAKVQKGTHILINGASGSVGTFCVQMAKAEGAIVTGVCSGKNADMVKSLGADHVIDYTQHDFTADGPKYDVILDNILNRRYKETSKALNPGGFIIPNSMGTERSKWWGAVPSFIIKPKNYPTAGCVNSHANLKHLAELISTGKCKVQIDKVYSIDEAPAAIAYMASHRAHGQVIIKVRQ